MRRFGDLPFPVGAGVIAGVTVASIALAIVANAGELWPLVLAVPIALAVWYLVGYSARPGPRSSRKTIEEPFEDPVEEADRVAQASSAESADPEISEPSGASTAAPVDPSGAATTEPPT